MSQRFLCTEHARCARVMDETCHSHPRGYGWTGDLFYNSFTHTAVGVADDVEALPWSG